MRVCAGHGPSEAQQKQGAALQEHVEALAAKMADVERYIKRTLPSHVPSCSKAELAVESSCAEHCIACTFGGGSCKSRPTACEKTHTERCTECAQARSLQPDFDHMLRNAEALINELVPPQTPWADGEKHSAAFADIRLALQKALAKFEHAHTHERRAAHEAKVCARPAAVLTFAEPIL